MRQRLLFSFILPSRNLIKEALVHDNINKGKWEVISLVNVENGVQVTLRDVSDSSNSVALNVFDVLVCNLLSVALASSVGGPARILVSEYVNTEEGTVTGVTVRVAGVVA